MTRHKALGAMGALMAGVLLSGCAGSPQSLPKVDESELVLTTPPGETVVDHVTWGLPTGEPSTLDPVKVGEESSAIVSANLCEKLLLLAPDFSVQPNLATFADWTDDTTFVFRIRPDVRFWDGTALTADDVAYSLGRTMDPGTGSIYTGMFQSAETIEVTGPDEVTIRFSAHDSRFRNSLATPVGAVYSKAFAEAAGATFGTSQGGVMCSGPYKLDSWSPGQKITTSVNTDYWGPESPHVKVLDYVFVTDDSTLTTALAAGEIDGAYALPNTAVNTLRGAKTGTVYFGPSTMSLMVLPATDTGPMANSTVRTALDMAIDKQKFIDTALGGFGSELKTFIPPLSFDGMEAADVYRTGYDALPVAEYDVEQARELISTVDLDRTTLVCAIQAGHQLSLTAATIVQAAAREIGLDVEIRQLQATDIATLFYEESAREGIDMVFSGGYMDSPGPLMYANEFVSPIGLFNWTHYEDPDVLAAMNASRVATDPVEVANAFVRAQTEYAKQTLRIELAQQYSTMFLNNDLTGALASFSYINAPWAAQLGGR